ncbi:MAG TPA: hypothetical protein VLG76_07715 [Rhabdochlamydiaceae bacterium]|nr:hypothetical protein [Rhabdochlamydiaceae bacterium]
MAAAGTIHTFRQFANELRNPVPYRPVTTELRGTANVVIGSLQLIVSRYMKYSSNPYYNSLEKRHVEIGFQALSLGLKQLTPAILASGTYYCYRNWSSN